MAARLCYDKAGASILIGARCFVTGSIFEACEVNIGDDVMISSGTAIFDHDLHSLMYSDRASDVQDWRQNRKDWTHVRLAPVTIESKVWIGYGVTILKGVRIGEGAVVGAGSVVTTDVAPHSVVIGNPQRFIHAHP